MTYAWFVLVKGKKRFGGMTHAESMEAAAVCAAKFCKLTLKITNLGTYWMLGNEKASLAIWTSPELFHAKNFPVEDARVFSIFAQTEYNLI